MRESKRTNDSIWVDGLGYCVEVTHTSFNGTNDEVYVSYTPINQIARLIKEISSSL